jgi:hypothetical protein
MAQRKRPNIPESLRQYYAASVGGSVIDSYKNGHTITVSAETSPSQECPDIQAAEATLRVAQDEIDKAYWRFSRSASRGPGRLADQTLYDCRNAARERLLDLRRAHQGGRCACVSESGA